MMNDELIRRLAEQAGAKVFPTVMVVADGGSSGRATEFIPRLIELVVGECLFIIDDERKPDMVNRTELWHQIVEHFGVEDNEEDETCPRCGDTWSGTSCGLPDCGWVTGVDSTN